MEKELQRIAASTAVDSASKLIPLIKRVRETLSDIDPLVRPRDVEGRTGGLLFLDRELPLIVLPDLHARKDFLFSVLMKDTGQGTVLQRLHEGSIQLLCVGDGFHSERRGIKRWQKALAEYRTGFRKHRNMDHEMAESLGLMQMVMLLKSSFPEHFFFLKGNHENILNEEGRGNHPFGKFVYEGEMVRVWTEKFMGMDFLYEYAEFEHDLPFMALADELIISHAEPRYYYHPEEIINIRDNDDIKLGLTWTANDEAEEESVESILEDYSERFNREFRYYIGGHRTIRTVYNLRASGLYVQIHNPEHQIVLYTDQVNEFDPDENIVDLQEIRSLPL
ncbi:MAG: metallophosphoesterase [Spirochaetales bacterium]|nr:metallophosphoesterase [Spirochaetales bacterium]